MLYGRSKRISCCYQCTKRDEWCHATCPDYEKEKKDRKAETMAKKMSLYPSSSRYFKKPEKVSKSAMCSKKRYR